MKTEVILAGVVVGCCFRKTLGSTRNRGSRRVGVVRFPGPRGCYRALCRNCCGSQGCRHTHPGEEISYILEARAKY